jgi:hypothetical protein
MLLLKNVRNEQPRHAACVLLPRFAVLLMAAFDVPLGAVHNHSREK